MKGCSGFFTSGMANRREFLQVGFAGGLGLGLPELLKFEAKAQAKFYESKEGVAKSLIHIFLPGGSAQQETWDPKPYAPVEYRGPYNAINTNVDGIQFSENFKNLAKVADKMTIIRSMTHGEAAHERGTHNMFTGYRPSPALKYPSFGSVISHEFGSRKNLPPYVCVPNVPNEFAGTGYLSTMYGPFSVGSDPAADKGFTVRDLTLPGGVDAARFERRRTMLEAVDNHFRSREKADAIDAMDSFYQKAYSLIGSPEARDAFDLTKEDEKTKERYGKNTAGMRMLLSRRLVESGVRLVTMTYGSWDHHDRIKDGIASQVPNFDKALATLLTDLDERGLLDSTMVMVSSEFGRTPKINKTDGRDHWPKVFSAMLAGGGIKGGYVHGSSDSLAAEPDENPVDVQSFAKTVYSQMGIVGDKELLAPGPRPIEIIDGGSVIDAIIAKATV
ncbi:MAG: DUF1501 domain-containing protein [Verrucomicrobiales bacterium]|jgi:hypothetical protein|nr:DUF1501 domain-containing protein [Verrucomicrobiales bacterium]MBP9223838.1 DUF1501 domain-containing protein [Verrucomicrobiales bacterium]